MLTHSSNYNKVNARISESIVLAPRLFYSYQWSTACKYQSSTVNTSASAWGQETGSGGITWARYQHRSYWRTKSLLDLNAPRTQSYCLFNKSYANEFLVITVARRCRTRTHSSWFVFQSYGIDSLNYFSSSLNSSSLFFLNS